MQATAAFFARRFTPCPVHQTSVCPGREIVEQSRRMPVGQHWVMPLFAPYGSNICVCLAVELICHQRLTIRSSKPRSGLSNSLASEAGSRRAPDDNCQGAYSTSEHSHSRGTHVLTVNLYPVSFSFGGSISSPKYHVLALPAKLPLLIVYWVPPRLFLPWQKTFGLRSLVENNV